MRYKKNYGIEKHSIILLKCSLICILLLGCGHHDSNLITNETNDIPVVERNPSGGIDTICSNDVKVEGEEESMAEEVSVMDESVVENEEESVAVDSDMKREEVLTLEEKIEQSNFAEEANQVILVIQDEEHLSRARLHYFLRKEGRFEEQFSTLAWIGANGLGKTKEGDKKTPEGVYTLSRPFGSQEDPGSQIGYTKLDERWYWIEDGNSIYYNQMVNIEEVVADWTEADHLIDAGRSYRYAIAIDYNLEQISGVGSAIFLHCTHDSATSGCIGIEEEYMIQILQSIEEKAG